MIKKYNANHVEFKAAWKLVVEKVPVEIVKEIAIATEQFYNHWPEHVTERIKINVHHIISQGNMVVSLYANSLSKKPGR